MHTNGSNAENKVHNKDFMTRDGADTLEEDYRKLAVKTRRMND